MKRSVKILWISLMTSLAFHSCDQMEDIHADFVKDGETIYASVPDTVQTLPGNNRIQLKWLVHNGNNIQKCIVEWEDSGEKKRQNLDVTLDFPLDSVLITINNLSEKSYLFYAYNVDSDGNRSIKKQVVGAVYGDIYESSLSNRPLTKMEGGGSVDSVVVFWGNVADGYMGTEVLYNNSAGEQVSKMIMPEDSELVIKDWESEGEMVYRSFYKPAPNAIDTFSSQSTSETLPVN